MKTWVYIAFGYSAIVGIEFFGISSAWADAKYVAGFTDAAGVVRSYGYTDDSKTPTAPDGMTAFVVPVSKFQDAGSMFKLQDGEVKALPKADMDAEALTRQKAAARESLYRARMRLEAMQLELKDTPAIAADIQADIDAQSAVVAQLRKDLSQ